MEVSKGKRLEYQIERLLFYRGFLARHHLTLKSYFYPEVVDVTDIDVLGIRFSDDFNPEVTICECKSGRSNSTIDRILWLKGLSKYFTTDNVMIVREKISGKIKKFAHEVGIIPIDFARLKELERIGAVPDIWIGSFDWENYDVLFSRYYQAIRGNLGLSRAYWLMRSKFWYIDNTTRLKQLITTLETISENPKPDHVRWLLYESSILMSVAILWLCHQTYSFNTDERSYYIKRALTTGIMPPDVAKKILGATYGVVASLVKEKTGESIYVDEKYLRLPLPKYAEPLIDLVERLMQRPKISKEIPRFLDLVCYEYLLKNREIDKRRIGEIFPRDTEMIAKLSKNIIRFMVAEKHVPEEIYQSLMDF